MNHWKSPVIKALCLAFLTMLILSLFRFTVILLEKAVFLLVFLMVLDVLALLWNWCRNSFGKHAVLSMGNLLLFVIGLSFFVLGGKLLFSWITAGILVFSIFYLYFSSAAK